MVDAAQEGQREALKRVAVELKRSELPFALAGGYAAWARGGPEPEHDVDFLVTEQDAGQAAEQLSRAGLRVEHPPEDWLFKVHTDGVTVDVIFRDSGEPARRSGVEDADILEVLSVRMPVLSATRVVTQKANALDEHTCDLANLLPVARALREQVDWEQVRADTAGNDYAACFLFLLERLGVAGAAGEGHRRTGLGLGVAIRAAMSHLVVLAARHQAKPSVLTGCPLPCRVGRGHGSAGTQASRFAPPDKRAAAGVPRRSPGLPGRAASLALKCG